MRSLAIVCTGLLAGGTVLADNLEGADELLCAAGHAQVCFENGECFSRAPWELSIPDFVVIDTNDKTVSTTKASGQNRTTPFASVERSDGIIYLQGIEAERAFSFVIEESTGHVTAAIARDGFSVTIFGVCTDTDI